MKKLIILCGMFAGVLAAASTPVLTQKKLDAMVNHWKHVLQLDDWHTPTFMVKINELPPGSSGASNPRPSMQVMSIEVLDPAEYPELAKRNGTHEITGKAILKDIEDTVLHELLHLRLMSVVHATSQAASDAAEEMTVVRLTTALLKKH